MALIAPKWDDAEFEVLEDGEYEAVVDASAAGKVETSKSGNEYIKVWFQIGEARIPRNFMLTGKGVAYFRDFLVALGLEPKETINTDDLHGKVCRVKVVKKTLDNGRTRNEVTEVFPAKGRRIA